MKTLKTLITLFALTLFVGAYAQTDNQQVMDKTKISNFSVESTKGTINYTVAMNTTATDYVKMRNLEKKEQTRKMTDKNVTTTISVDNDFDNFYDNVIMLTYEAVNEDPVKVMPTATGFDIKVNGEMLSYDFLRKECSMRKGCPIEVKMSDNNM